MRKIVINGTTGQAVEVELTPVEVLAKQADDSASEADRPTRERNAWFADHDAKHMPRVIEDVVVSLKTGQPIPQAAIDKINVRRAKRGLVPV